MPLWGVAQDRLNEDRRYNNSKSKKYADKADKTDNKLAGSGSYDFKTLECYVAVIHGANEKPSGAGNYCNLPCYPDEVAEEISATWSEQTIVGRSAPISAYVATSDRNVSFSFTLHREMYVQPEVKLSDIFSPIDTSKYWIGRGIDKVQTVISDISSTIMEFFNKGAYYNNIDHDNRIDRCIALIKSGVYPRYDQNTLYPPITIFGFGDFYICGKLKSVRTNWKKPVIDGKYQLCEISVSIDSISDKILGTDDVKNMVPRGIGNY